MSLKKKVSINEIMMQKARVGNRHLADLPRDFFNYRPKLYKSLAMPSYVHGYSLAIEFMRSWFISKFPKDYFKCIHINGKHVLDDWKHFNNLNIKREKPMLAIVPTVEYDFDRETVDTYLADQDMFLKRSNYQQSFLKDYQNNVFLAMQMRALRMNFGFKVRVSSRSQQLDLFNRMEIWFRIGATQQQDLSADIHVPYDIMYAMAKDLNFETDDSNKTIKHVVEFIAYINEHSELPFIFKMRAINQKPEFFVRIRNLYTHISCKDKLQLDDGEREGKLDTNYHIEMQATLTIPIPQFFVYFSQQAIIDRLLVKDTMDIGIYSINGFEIPPENELGWGQFAQTGYLSEPGEEYIDLSEIFRGDGNVNRVVEYSIKQSISPSSFIDVRAYYGSDVAKKVNFVMNYDKLTMVFDKPIEKEDMITIAIYADKRYINETIIMLNNYNSNRVEKQ